MVQLTDAPGFCEGDMGVMTGLGTNALKSGQ